MTAFRGWPRLALAFACVTFSAGVASAQTPSGDHPWEFSGGVQWTRGFSLAGVAGIETQPNGNPFPLFTATTRIDPAWGAHVALSRRIVGPLAFEGDGTLEHTTYRSTTTADFEQAASADVTNSATTFTAGGSLVATFARHSRVQPFVRAGLSWRRELSSDNTLSGDGHLLVAGGGIKYWFGGPTTGRFGLRVEADAVGRSGGLAIGDSTRFAPGFSAGCSLRF